MEPYKHFHIWSNASNSSINSSLVGHVAENGTDAAYFHLSLTVMVYVGLLVGIIFFAMIGNLLVILVFVFDRRLHVSSSYYVLSLAVSDIITAALVMTLEVDQFLGNNKWRHSKALCEAWTTAYLFTVPVSILTACVSSIDRWYAISRPLRYRTGRNGMKHKALCVIILVWIYSVLFALLPKMGWKSKRDFNITEDQCYFDIDVEYSIISSALNFILPSIITAIFYFNMFTAMKKHTSRRRKLSSASDQFNRSPSHRQRKSERANFVRNVRLAKSYALIGSLLIVTWCPFTIISILRNVCSLAKTQACAAVTNMDGRVDISLLMLGYFSSAINPIVYVLRFRGFRQTIKEWFNCRGKFSLL